MTTMTSVAAGIWTIDPAHTRAEFAAGHLFGQMVHGTIAVTAGTIEVGPDGQPQRFHAALDPASIDTGHARRDARPARQALPRRRRVPDDGDRRGADRSDRRRLARRRDAARARMRSAAVH